MCVYIYIYMLPPLKDPRVLALFGRNPLNHDSRVLVLFGKNPSNMTQLIRKNPSIPQHCLETLGTHISYNIMCMQGVLTLMYVSMHMVHG